jgi:hypothetical protein
MLENVCIFAMDMGIKIHCNHLMYSDIQIDFFFFFFICHTINIREKMFKDNDKSTGVEYINAQC